MRPASAAGDPETQFLKPSDQQVLPFDSEQRRMLFNELHAIMNGSWMKSKVASFSKLAVDRPDE
jgi:hypothetical protein